MVMTIGIEVETTNLSLRDWEKIRKPYGWTTVTDGSIRTKQAKYTKIANCNFRTETESFGAELVSPIIYVDENMWSGILPIFSLVKSSGEVARANNSIHIHIGLPDLMLVVRRWGWLKEVDKILYDVSAPEGIPRGMYNDFIYYRPLVSPQWAYTDGARYAPSIGQVENAKSLDDVKFAFGRYDRLPPKWYPSRYCGINVVSYFTHTTLEFRHFNFTQDFSVFKSWVLLCLGIVISLMQGNNQVSPEYLLCLGAREAGDKTALKKCTLPNNDIFNMINVSPVNTHTGRTIYWNEPSSVNSPSSLIPKESVSKIREVANVHPSNILGTTTREQTIVYSIQKENNV
jgi:hypothetical protein